MPSRLDTNLVEQLFQPLLEGLRDKVRLSSKFQNIHKQYYDTALLPSSTRMGRSLRFEQLSRVGQHTCSLTRDTRRVRKQNTMDVG